MAAIELWQLNCINNVLYYFHVSGKANREFENTKTEGEKLQRIFLFSKCFLVKALGAALTVDVLCVLKQNLTTCQATEVEKNPKLKNNKSATGNRKRKGDMERIHHGTEAARCIAVLVHFCHSYTRETETSVLD